MRAEIEIKTIPQTRKAGFFKTETYNLYQVWPNIKFTREELDIIEQFNLWERVCYTRTADVSHLDAKMRAQLAGQNMTYSITLIQIGQPTFNIGVGDPVQAQKVAREIEEDVLPTIKAYISQCAAPTGKRIVDL